MTIFETHRLLKLAADKADKGYFPPEELDDFLDMASRWLFTEYKPFYGKDRDKTAALLPFKESYDFTSNSSGVFSIVTANVYVEKLSLSASVFNNDLNITEYFDIDFINDDERAQRLNSQLRKVDTTSPVVEETIPGTFQIYPKQVTGGTVRFLREPKKPLFAYTQVGRVITHNAGASQDLEWTGMYLNKVIMKALTLMGITLDNSWLRENGMGLQQSNV